MVRLVSYWVRYGCRVVGSKHSQFILGLCRTETGTCASYGLHTLTECYIPGFHSAGAELVVAADLTTAELSIRKYGSGSKISLRGRSIPA